jgi:hypothetical protein
VRESALASRGEERQDVERPQRPGLLGGVVVAVDRGERLSQGIHVGDGDQPPPEIVRPLVSAERILEQHPRITRCLRGPALRLMSMTMKSRP